MIKRYQSINPLVFAIVTGAAILFLSLSYNISVYKNDVAKARSRVQNILSVYRSRLETGLYSRLFLTKTLAGYVSRNPDINHKQFEAMVIDAVRNDRAINSISLSKNSVITYIYPVKGHEAAIGLDLMAHPERRYMVEDIIRRRANHVQGPVTLVEGGVAFIMYTPIYLADRREMGEYWGLADIVLLSDTLFREAGFMDEMSEIEISVRGKDGKGADGEVFWGGKEIYGRGPVYQMVTLPNGSWQLAAVPKGGWPAYWREQALTMLVGVLLSLLVGAAVYVIMRKPERLIKDIDERKKVEAALRESEKELKEHRENLEAAVAERADSILRMNEHLRQEIVERKEMERKIHEMSGRVLSAHESERKRLARELHDGLGHLLLSIKMKILTLKEEGLENKEALESCVAEAVNGISDSINDLRDIAMALRPSHLEDSEMDDILRWHGKKFEDSSGIKVSVDAEPIAGLNLKVKENLYRILQEALNNIAKHAGADKVKIELKQENDRLRMVVADNGKGFKQDVKGEMPGGVGLFTMRDRAIFIDGSFAVDSLPQAGTTVVVEAPIG